MIMILQSVSVWFTSCLVNEIVQHCQILNLAFHRVFTVSVRYNSRNNIENYSLNLMSSFTIQNFFH